MQGYGYGFPQQGYGGQQGQYDQQQQWAMQQQWAQQQAYMAQMQQQQGCGGYGYGQQQAMQQQMQQGYGGQQAPEAHQDPSLGQRSQKGGRGGKGGDKGGGKDSIRRAMEGDRQAPMAGGGGGGGKGGAGGFGPTGDERTSKQAGGGGKKKESSEMTLEEYQAEKARKSAERKAAQAEAQAEARRQAAARMAAAEAGVPMEEPPEEPPKQAAAKREKTPEPEPPKPAPAPAAKAVEPAAEAEEDDWEAAADATEEPSPPPPPEPVKEPVKEVQEAKEEKSAEAVAPVEATEEAGETEEALQLVVGMKVKALEDIADYEDSYTATAGTTGVVKEIDLDEGKGALLDGGFGDHWFAQAVWCQLEIVEEEDEKKSNLRIPDPRPHLNVVFIGHVDAGKSTTCGNILYLSNCVDERTIEKYMKEAKDKNRESWFLAYIMDTNEEEKAKGKTVEVGRATFETENRRFTILDAPGHKAYVPNMVAGASQADIGVLIISARKGEFETGFERGGQTREHAQLAKTLGVDKLVVAVNKMDDPSVEWAQSRFDEIQTKMTPFLKQQGYKEDQFVFLPLSGLTGDNIKEKKNSPSWVNTKPLLDTLDSLEPPERKVEAPLRIPMLDGFKDMGQTMAIGKVEQGQVKPGLKCIVMPTGHKCTVLSVRMKCDPKSETDEEMAFASCGENVTMRMHGISEDALQKGFVLCPLPSPIPVVTKFKAQIKVLELPEERPVMTKGYKCVLHVHVANEECEIFKLYETVYKKKKELKPDFALKDSVLTCSISLARSIALDTFASTPQLGRFTLRDESKTIAIGKIIELPKSAAS